MKLRDVSKLEKCALWQGCMLQIAHRYGGVTIDEVEKRIVQMERCGDLTKEEKALLLALKQTVIDHKDKE